MKAPLTIISRGTAAVLTWRRRAGSAPRYPDRPMQRRLLSLLVASGALQRGRTAPLELPPVTRTPAPHA